MTTAPHQIELALSRDAVGIGSDALVRPFAMGELWAGSEGMKCEHPGCTRRTCMIYLTAAENASLPESSGPHACLKIFNDHLGKVLCELHGPNDEAQTPRWGCPNTMVFSDFTARHRGCL